MSQIQSVTLTDLQTVAAQDTLLAIEIYAERVYGDRHADADSQRHYNDLAAVVLPLRAAITAAINAEATR